ncbi:MAG: site-2 protease family protein [Nitrospirae bacterium]|nr:site-2 protease family protein [Nitrospirota bacterium]MBI3351816.1 site-2 protease family protein [Nitrospirota bacterium]
MEAFYPIFAQIAVSAIPILFAITLHETAHGWVANKLGDPTARLQGRLTLNPVPHIDPMMTVIFPIMTLILSRGAFIFGGAKPVPVNFGNLRNPKRDMILVAAAGPGINLGIALIAGLLFRFLTGIYPGIFAYIHSSNHFSTWSQLDMAITVPLGLMLLAAVKWNVLLAVFNMIPIPPLDGGRVMVGLLPVRFSNLLSQLEPFGIFIVILLIFIDPLGLTSHLIFRTMHLISWFFVGVDPFMV